VWKEKIIRRQIKVVHTGGAKMRVRSQSLDHLSSHSTKLSPNSKQHNPNPLKLGHITTSQLLQLMEIGWNNIFIFLSKNA